MLTIIQARMNSTRLPGKVMKEVCGKPLIGHLLDRLSFAKSLGQIVVATSVSPDDDRLVRYVEFLGVKVFRGSQEDVLSRYFLAAQKYQADHVVRLTGDCPLMDPALCDAVVQTYLEKKVDYLSTGLSFAEGMSVEIVSFSALEKAHQNARLRSEREHVMPYIKNHPESFKIYILENATDDSQYRLTVDEPQDFEVIKSIFEALSLGSGVFTIEQIKAFIDQNPQIAKLNRHIIRKEGYAKSLREDSIVDVQ